MSFPTREELEALDPLTAEDISDWSYSVNARYLTHLYQATGNPLYLWDLYREARHWKQPVPEVVLAYFDECAAALHDMDPDPKRVGESVRQAVGLHTGKRGRGFFAQRPKAKQRLWIMRWVHHVMANPANDRYQVFIDAEEMFAPDGPSADTIQNWYYEDREFFGNSRN